MKYSMFFFVMSFIVGGLTVAFYYCDYRFIEKAIEFRIAEVDSNSEENERRAQLLREMSAHLDRDVVAQCEIYFNRFNKYDSNDPLLKEIKHRDSLSQMIPCILSGECSMMVPSLELRQDIVSKRLMFGTYMFPGNNIDHYILSAGQDARRVYDLFDRTLVLSVGEPVTLEVLDVKYNHSEIRIDTFRITRELLLCENNFEFQ